MRRVDRVLQDGGEFRGPEREPAHLRVALDVDQVLRPQQQGELAAVIQDAIDTTSTDAVPTRTAVNGAMQ